MHFGLLGPPFYQGTVITCFPSSILLICQVTASITCAHPHRYLCYVLISSFSRHLPLSRSWLRESKKFDQTPSPSPKFWCYLVPEFRFRFGTILVPMCTPLPFLSKQSSDCVPSARVITLSSHEAVCFSLVHLIYMCIALGFPTNHLPCPLPPQPLEYTSITLQSRQCGHIAYSCMPIEHQAKNPPRQHPGQLSGHFERGILSAGILYDLRFTHPSFLSSPRLKHYLFSGHCYRGFCSQTFTRTTSYTVQLTPFPPLPPGSTAFLSNTSPSYLHSL